MNSVASLAMVAALLGAPPDSTAPSSTTPSSSHVTVVFLPDDGAAPAAALTIDNDGAVRTMRWVLAPSGAVPPSGAVISAPGTASSLMLPLAPAGGSLVERDGGLILTVDDAGAWQEPLKSLLRSRIGAPAVAGPRTLRLVVSSHAAGSPALLVGTEVRVAGRAVVLRERVAAVSVVWLPDKSVLIAPVHAVADGQLCGWPAGRAFSAPHELLRLVVDGARAPGCAPGLALTAVTGTRTEPRRDVPVSGLVVFAGG